MDIKKIITIVENIIALEKIVEEEIGKVENAKKRKAIHEAYINRNSNAMRDSWFGSE